MNSSRSCRLPLAATCAALVALMLANLDAASAWSEGPTVKTSYGAVRGVDVPDGYTFRGLPYASAPVGRLRWRAPRRPASWSGGRDSSRYAPC